MSADAVVDAAASRDRRSLPLAVFRALRPRQWVKNLLLFAGVVFAAELGDPVKWLEAISAFVIYCAASSASYLVNDVRDREADRAHPIKRWRPIARGEVSPPVALGLSAGLFAGAFALAVALGVGSVALLAAFVLVQAAYTLQLKHVVLLDVFAIAALFVIRAAAGAAAVHVPISPWLLLCTGLLALFLAFAKRRGELLLVHQLETPGRKVLAGYSLAVIDQYVGIVAAATIVSYALYTFTARQSHVLMVTIPYVVFGIFRYLLLMHQHEAGEEPEQVLVSDWPILTAVVLFAVTSAVILLAR